MPTRSEAFAEQAGSDLDAYELIAKSSLPSSHRLHYLQMWLEKLCKAYLLLPSASQDGLLGKHNVVGKVLPLAKSATKTRAWSMDGPGPWVSPAAPTTSSEVD